jgi:predicted transcriptional regulator
MKEGKKMSKSTAELAAELVASFVSHNSVPKSELLDLIQTVHDRLKQIEAGPEAASPQPQPKAPAVPIRKSVTQNYLICLDDGRKFKSLRRHLATLGMTPEQYRVKWGLPKDYPMVAPTYAATRSALAKSIGLGQMRKKTNRSKAK